MDETILHEAAVRGVINDQIELTNRVPKGPEFALFDFSVPLVTYQPGPQGGDVIRRLLPVRVNGTVFNDDVSPVNGSFISIPDADEKFGISVDPVTNGVGGFVYDAPAAWFDGSESQSLSVWLLPRLPAPENLTPMEVVLLVKATNGLPPSDGWMVFGVDNAEYTALELLVVDAVSKFALITAYTSVGGAVRLASAEGFMGGDWHTVGVRVDGPATAIYLDGVLLEWDGAAADHVGDPYDWVTGMPVGVGLDHLGSTIAFDGGWSGYMASLGSPNFVSPSMRVSKIAYLPIFDSDEDRVSYSAGWLSEVPVIPQP